MYSHEQAIHDKLNTGDSTLKMYERIPEDFKLTSLDNTKVNLLIVDELLTKARESNLITDKRTRRSHLFNLNFIDLTQNPISGSVKNTTQNKFYI